MRDPVILVQTCEIFEKRALLAHIQAGRQRCPVTNAALTKPLLYRAHAELQQVMTLITLMMTQLKS